MENIKSPDDLDRLKVPDLRSFLEARGVRKSGNKPELLEMAKLYFRQVMISF